MTTGKYSIGIVVPHLGASQLAYYTIQAVNKIKDTDCVIYYENMVFPCIKPSCAVMCLNHMINFEGVLISTTINTTISAINVGHKAKHIFYVWDVEWLRIGKQSFLYNLQAYRNNIILVCRDYSHSKLLANYCNRKDINVIPEFDIEKIASLI